MFARKGTDEIEQDVSGQVGTDAMPQLPSVSRTVAAPSLARRVSAPRTAGDERRLTVGRGLSLAGEIASCDVLVVEGKVEAKLSEGKLLEITETGQFRGNVEIENADIAGRYDGQLIVHGRLTIRSTGRISGMVKYGELEVSAGGQIIGEMSIVGASQQEQRGPAFKNVAKIGTSASETEEPSTSSEHISA